MNNQTKKVETNVEVTSKKNNLPKWIIGTVAVAAIVTAVLNASPSMARTLADVPVLGSAVKVLTFVDYKVEEDTYAANIEVPAISGESADIKALNEKYAKEGKALYEKFIAEVGHVEGSYLSVDSGYIVQTDTEKLLSVGRYVAETAGSSTMAIQYDTVDKQKEMVITLPSLFKDESYISVISEYIAEQMRQQMKDTNQEKTYWVSDAGLTDEQQVDLFTTIKADQNFYITQEGKLVIVFNEYEVAPGYMGIVEFQIPTALLSDVLVSNEYIQG